MLFLYVQILGSSGWRKKKIAIHTNSADGGTLPAVQLCSDNQWCMLEYPNIGCIGLDAPSTQPKKFHPDPSIQKEANNATNIANFDWLIRNGLKFTRTWTALLLSHIHTEAENVSMLFKSR